MGVDMALSRAALGVAACVLSLAGMGSQAAPSVSGADTAIMTLPNGRTTSLIRHRF
jgi:hypothetical protein